MTEVRRKLDHVGKVGILLRIARFSQNQSFFKAEGIANSIINYYLAIYTLEVVNLEFYHVVLMKLLSFISKLAIQVSMKKCIGSTTGCLKNKSTYLRVMSFTLPISLSLFLTKFEIDNPIFRFFLYHIFFLILLVSLGVLELIQLIIFLNTYSTDFQGLGSFIGDS